MGQSKDQRRSEGMTGFKEGNKCLLLFASIILTLWTTQSESLNLDHLQPSFENIEYNETQQLSNRGPEIRPMETSKRGIDFGLGRGFSGSQAAKHFLGMAAARYSGGPGKRAVKRSH